MLNINAVNSEILNLWRDKFPDDEKVYMPMFINEPKKKCLLFVGLNPSFSKSGYKSILSKTGYINLIPEEFYSWKNSESFEIWKDLEIERTSRANYPYYSKFRKISEELNMCWEHVDMFFYRETKQANIEEVIFDKKSGYELNEFGEKQFELSMKIINNAEPKVIVIVNALASKIFNNKFRDKMQFLDNEGFHTFGLSSGISVPVFFSSMLTGQRALDDGSFDRLKWHIKKAITYYNNTY